MTRHARKTQSRLQYRKQASVPKVITWQTYATNTTLVNSIMLGVLALLAIGYLGIMNSAAGDTFRVFELTHAIEETQESNTDLQLAISELQSLQHVKEMSEDSGYIAVANVQYLDTDSAVALSQ